MQTQIVKPKKESLREATKVVTHKVVVTEKDNAKKIFTKKIQRAKR